MSSSCHHTWTNLFAIESGLHDRQVAAVFWGVQVDRLADVHARESIVTRVASPPCGTRLSGELPDREASFRGRRKGQVFGDSRACQQVSVAPDSAMLPA